jgi:hypothetical protein
MADEKDPAAVSLGQRGGKKTALKGPEYYQELQSKRQAYKGGRPSDLERYQRDQDLFLGDLQRLQDADTVQKLVNLAKRAGYSVDELLAMARSGGPQEVLDRLSERLKK